MQETLISFETAKLAKEKGFDIYQAKQYSENVNPTTLFNYSQGQCEIFKDLCFAPTQTLLQKWLRDVHNIHIEVDYSFDYQKYCYIVHNKKGARIVAEMFFLEADIKEYLKYETYEEALEIGLQEALKLT